MRRDIRARGGISGRDVSASFSNGQGSRAERVDGPDHERERIRRGEEARGEEGKGSRVARWWVYERRRPGGEDGEVEGRKTREPGVYPVFEPKVLRAS